MFHKLNSVAPLEGFHLLLHFADGSTKEYDMSALIRSHPAFAALSTTPGLFNQVVVDPGGYGISWNDDIDLDCEELYENSAAVETPFTDLLSLFDATSLWGLNESTLRKAISYGKLKPGLDVLKFGKQWVVTRAAMLREYGQPS